MKKNEPLTDSFVKNVITRLCEKIPATQMNADWINWSDEKTFSYLHEILTEAMTCDRLRDEERLVLYERFSEENIKTKELVKESTGLIPSQSSKHEKSALRTLTHPLRLGTPLKFLYLATKHPVTAAQLLTSHEQLKQKNASHTGWSTR